MKSKVLVAVFVFAQLASRAFAQFGSGIVFDPTQSGHAIEQIQQAQQLYTTALQTRDTVITTYNLARQMASLPSALYQHYVTPWTVWNNVYAGNTYGNVQAWINAANTSNGVNVGYTQASINPASRYPLYGNLSPQSQQLIAAQGATSDLNDGITETSLQTLGTMHARSEAREADLRPMHPQAGTNKGNDGKSQRAGRGKDRLAILITIALPTTQFGCFCLQYAPSSTQLAAGFNFPWFVQLVVLASYAYTLIDYYDNTI